jgi:predicted  nucleic acid-binding Zn-ribbon protein
MTMDIVKAKQALAEIKVKVSALKQEIASLKQDKQKIKVDLSAIRTRKKARLKSLQDDINKTRLQQQKKYKRATKERESNSFDSQITERVRRIERIDNNILNKEKEIADLKNIEQRIKLAFTKQGL